MDVWGWRHSKCFLEKIVLSLIHFLNLYLENKGLGYASISDVQNLNAIVVFIRAN